jgi:hypothetical protein
MGGSGSDGSLRPQDMNNPCPPNSYDEDHSYGHPHSHSHPHSHTPPPPFGSGYLQHSRAPSAYEMMSSRDGHHHSLRRDSTGLEPPFGMH